MTKYFFLTPLFLLYSVFANSQVITKEDSLAAGLIASNNATVLSGYGSFCYENNISYKDATINLDRLVLFMGHKFNKRISFFSELELEDAKIVGGETGGEFSIEQAFLKFNVSRNSYITTGLFIPRIGIINENHLPTTFNGNKRPMVETLLIPSTWRELGIGYYGSSNRIPGLNYSLALINGLNCSKFENGSGIKEGRFEGKNANASSIAISGALLHYIGKFRTQFSVYYGGSSGMTPREADSLQLNSGFFGTPVALSDFNVQYMGNKISVKALATFIAIPDAYKINMAFGSNIPEQMFGYYIEAGYNFYIKESKTARFYGRFESLDLNKKIPENGIYNGTITQKYIVTGFSFLPLNGVIIKCDYTYRMTGDINPALIINPYPQGIPYYKNQHLVQVGVGYSF